ncbi:Protein CBG26812 [Caenorhabditis briggsae]|uniref:Protein CBG26812 n=2 Tax=Caenorhabditis briggsae TaxID=6238 RepID=B6IIC8_CAEBR|nr:Protein CBG26812 [Caenorhabditis briggsae]UMM40764.1 hypothetical protein L5515_017280 [Caenorhabditis briggsae]CAR99658.1 Protein CBG26812 [Caenorhabditis briggsae]
MNAVIPSRGTNQKRRSKRLLLQSESVHVCSWTCSCTRLVNQTPISVLRKRGNMSLSTREHFDWITAPKSRSFRKNKT